jgi:hypothetical protein
MSGKSHTHDKDDDDDDDAPPIEKRKRIVAQEAAESKSSLSWLHSSVKTVGAVIKTSLKTITLHTMGPYISDALFETESERHAERLRVIKPVDDEFIIEGEHCACKICFDWFEPHNVVQCKRNAGHTLCIPCFAKHCDTCATLADLICPTLGCKSAYDDAVLQLAVSQERFAVLVQKQCDLDASVAVASGVERALYCKCGFVGVVEKATAGDSTVRCQCGEVYCLKCGNYTHPGTLCPPPANTLRTLDKQWIDAHAKLCPSCGFAIEKNGGCSHMTCGRCRHHFCWQCLRAMQWPYRLCNCRL